MPAISLILELDPESEDRLNRIARESGCEPEAILRKGLDQFLEAEGEAERTSQGRHPSGKPWPSRNPVGGIITPV